MKTALPQSLQRVIKLSISFLRHVSPEVLILIKCDPAASPPSKKVLILVLVEVIGRSGKLDVIEIERMIIRILGAFVEIT
jgi:hypothetical protein